jgi:hypothetical protein
VDQVLRPTSLILKIWQAWAEEQPNVTFIVKRVKQKQFQPIQVMNKAQPIQVVEQT